MGSSRVESSGTIDQTQQTTFDPASAREQELLGQFGSLGDAQRGALMDRLQSLTSGASPFSLSPQDQAQLDTAFNSAQQQLDLSNREFADYLAGGRNLRMSDTPISSQAMQRQALGQAELLSQRALAGLNLGLQGSQYRNSSALGLAGAMPAGSLSAFAPLFNQRMASGTTRTTGRTTNTQTNTPSIMSQISQGLGIAGQLGAMGAGAMSGLGFAGGGIPLGGMAGGLGSAQGMAQPMQFQYNAPIGPMPVR